MKTETPILPLPIVPTNLVVELESDTEVLLSWLNLNGDDIEIERTGNLNYAPKTTFQKDAKAVAYLDTQLSPGTDYYYRIRAVNETGSSPYSEFVGIRTPEVSPRPSLLEPVQSAVEPKFDSVTKTIEQRLGDDSVSEVLFEKSSLRTKLITILIGLGLIALGMVIVTLKRN